jgi:hypothetical protein
MRKKFSGVLRHAALPASPQLMNFTAALLLFISLFAGLYLST